MKRGRGVTNSNYPTLPDDQIEVARWWIDVAEIRLIISLLETRVSRFGGEIEARRAACPTSCSPTPARRWRSGLPASMKGLLRPML